jgi:hypothetical protein
MAGRARTRAIIEELEKRTRQYFDTEDGPKTPLDYVCARVEDRTTVKAIAKELSDTLHDDVTYDRVMAILRTQNGADAADAAIDLARARASHSLAEESLEIVDAYADTTVDVSRAASRARSRQWLAQRRMAKTRA